jgi:serine/threonine-protein kinase
MAAVKLPAGERRCYIDRQAAGDAEVVDQAVQLLNRYDDPTTEIGAAVRIPELDRQGTSVAGWEIEEHLGDGGFAVVYRASRTLTGGRGKEEAAVKFLRPFTREDQGQMVERFEQERQIVADLYHEGIARFLGGGEDDGSLYVILEYVSGLPIATYCHQQKLNIGQRLDLFLRLCRIIEYAHDSGVLHRDLKPGNILMTAQGSPRVLDFGIAKLMVAGGVTTRAPGFLGTKSYASPEQVKGEAQSFATDVYALGVLLYELVVGRRPFSDFALNGTDWIQVICERPPIPPSAAVTIDDRSATPPPGMTARQLKKYLAGDLDAIILKALSKDPLLRYPRVDRLREDIERCLAGLSVSARPSGSVERLIKWSNANRWTAIALAASCLWTGLIMHFGALQFIDLNTQLQNESAAERRLRYLAEAGLPNLETSLAGLPESLETRRSLASIHADLLQRLDSLPRLASRDIDFSLMVSALQCARQQRALGEAQAALDVLNPAVSRAEARYRWNQLQGGGRYPEWPALYGELLRLRIEVRGSLNQDTSADATALAGIEKGRR